MPGNLPRVRGFPPKADSPRPAAVRCRESLALSSREQVAAMRISFFVEDEQPLLGHRMGVDFSLADESDVRSTGPLILLGAAVLLAFPIAGFLVAKASAAHSVLEPALAAGLALTALVAMLFVTAPVGVLFALAVAPLAFGLACGGAWIGLER